MEEECGIGEEVEEERWVLLERGFRGERDEGFEEVDKEGFVEYWLLICCFLATLLMVRDAALRVT